MCTGFSSLHGRQTPRGDKRLRQRFLCRLRTFRPPPCGRSKYHLSSPRAGAAVPCRPPERSPLDGSQETAARIGYNGPQRLREHGSGKFPFRPAGILFAAFAASERRDVRVAFAFHACRLPDVRFIRQEAASVRGAVQPSNGPERTLSGSTPSIILPVARAPLLSRRTNPNPDVWRDVLGMPGEMYPNPSLLHRMTIAPERPYRPIATA